MRPYIDEFFGNVEMIFDKQDRRFATAFYHKLNPMIYCQEKSMINRFEDLLKRQSEKNYLSQLIEDTLEELKIIHKIIT